MKKDCKEISNKEISLEKDLYIEALKSNVEKYVKNTDCTLKELAEKANIPFSTLNNLLYSKTYKDCKLSTAINLSKAIGVSIDELIGDTTLPEEEASLIKAMRLLPQRAKYMVQWFINYQIKLSETYDTHKKRIVNVMYPRTELSDNLAPSEDFRPLDISELSSETKSKVFLGVAITCDYYMPHFSPYDIVLIANDRPAKPNEICLILHCGHLYLVKRQKKFVGHKVIHQYVSIRDGVIRIDETDAEHLFGYVADVYRDMEG